MHLLARVQKTAARALAALLAAALFAAPAEAQEKAAGIAAQPNQVRGDEINPKQQAAVDRGLAWLAKAQGKDGRYGESSGSTAGVTALAGLAFMQAGNLPNRGKYGAEVKRCVDYVLATCQPDGLVAADASSPMYGHGFATLFLGEVYGMTADESVRDPLAKAVTLIEKTQNPEGGWRYQPAPVDADISVTICEIMALRAARDAGIKVRKETIDAAVRYVRNCQTPDGGFSYQAHGGSGSGYARTAAGVASLYYAGVFDGNDLTRGLRYLDQRVPQRNNPLAAAGGMDEGNFFYGNYYAVQAMFLAGGDHWGKFYPAVRDLLVARQQPGGQWSGDSPGDDYCTAMALVILQMPNRYLPVYAGKGPGG